MKQSIGPGLVALLMGGIAAALNSAESNAFGEGLTSVIVIILAVGAVLIGLMGLIKGNVAGKVLAVVGIVVGVIVFLKAID